MTEPCRCPLCRESMRNLPHGSRTWHCSVCGETMTQAYLNAWWAERVTFLGPACALELPRLRP